MIYVASPYSGTEEEQITRFVFVASYVAHLISKGIVAFSPIVHNHTVVTLCVEQLPTGWEFWQKYDSDMLKRCDELYVLKLPGWEESVGVNAERELAKNLGIPITYVEDETYTTHQ
jgi:hypothetical protein